MLTPSPAALRDNLSDYLPHTNENYESLDSSTYQDEQHIEVITGNRIQHSDIRVTDEALPAGWMPRQDPPLPDTNLPIDWMVRQKPLFPDPNPPNGWMPRQSPLLTDPNLPD